MSLSVTTSIPAQAWDEFTSSNPNANIFHTRQFVDCFRDSPKYAPHTYFLIENNDIVALIVAIQTKILGDHLERFSSRCVVFGGILYSNELSERYVQRHITELVHAYDEAMSRQSLYSELRNMENATALMLELGFDEVYHLQGGILKYLEEMPAQENQWDGECFVFDTRVAVDRDLAEGGYVQCHACRRPLSSEEIASPDYQEGISCPKCIDEVDEERKAGLRERQKQVELARERGDIHIGPK